MTLRETAAGIDVMTLVAGAFVDMQAMVTVAVVTGFLFGLTIVELLAERYFCKYFVVVSESALIEDAANFFVAVLLLLLVVVVVVVVVVAAV